MERKPLTAERWRQIEAVFNQAADADEPARAGMLARLCESDPELHREVAAMLSAADCESSPAARSNEEPSVDLAGRRVGNYRLDRLLGEGGMGSVYLASRADGQFEQQAAVKLLAPYLRSQLFTERFRFERQALANLSHPNVTSILDSGVTPEGDPFLVMEYVDGQPIDSYCDERRFTIPERVQLFLQVCEAVEYTHRNRIVHRDLKPGNIFVCRGGTVKLLDFGTAKLLEIANAAEGSDAITRTQFRMMTPRYASPEQLRGEPLSQLTDVYSLGIVLYELLTGAWPFGDPASAIAGLERAVRDVNPQPPTRAITEEAAEARSTPFAKLARTIEGDLANIALKAIQPDPRRRYSSAEGLAEDLRGYLNGKPVGARAQTAIYRAQKFARRNKPALAAAAVAGIAIAGAFLFGRGTAQSKLTSIAVLPFTNLSADASNQYFSDGLTDEITGELARVKNLRVTARASAFQFRGTTVNLRKVGAQLNVSTILEGSVARDGDRIKIIAHLDRVSDGSQLWSKTYERKSSDLFGLQSELASAIASSLNVPTVAENPARHPIRDEEAHDAYMRARYELDKATTESVLRAQVDFQRVIERDPAYAPAYAGLGSARYNLGAAKFNSKFSDPAGSVQMWRKALELDPASEEAHCGLAMIAMQYDWNWTQAEREVQAALAAAPSARAEIRYASILVFQRRFDEAQEHLLRSQEIDPLGVAFMLSRGQMWLLSNRLHQARGEIQKVLDRHPDIVQAQSTLSFIDFAEGHSAQALSRIENLAAQLPWTGGIEAYFLALLGRRDEALKLIRPLEEKAESGAAPLATFAMFYAALGDQTNAIKWLERSADRHEWQALSIAVNSAYSNLQTAAGYKALERRMGLAR